MEEIATRSTWQNHPITNPRRIDIDLHFSNKQFSQIKKGLIPEQMEDKWFIFYEKGWLYFHRSWTSNGIYKARLIKEKGGYYIKELWAENDQEIWESTGDNEDVHTFFFLIAMGLLGIDVRTFYSEQNIKTQLDTVHTWTKFGAMFFTPDLFEDDESSTSTNDIEK
jgi:hypothetical protein